MTKVIDLHGQDKIDDAEKLIADFKPKARSSRLKLTKASETKAKPVKWLWHYRFPLSHLSIAVGKPDLGKSTFAVWIAARVSKGELDGEFKNCPKGVIYYTTEDSWEMTVRPRLEAAGANLDNVYRLDAEQMSGKGYSINLVNDLGALETLIDDYDIGLIIFDPLVSVVGGKNWNDANDVYDRLLPFTQMLERTNCACLGLMHFRKAFGTDVLDQISGSGAWSRIVRAGVAFIRDPDCEDKQVIMSQAKSNLGPGNLANMTFTFQSVTIHTDYGPGEWSKIVWGDESSFSVEDILLGKNTDKAKSAVELAIEWLADYLSDGEPRLINDVKRDAEIAGHSDRTIDRAKARLPIIAKRAGDGGRGKMTWKLDNQSANLEAMGV